MTTGHEEQYGDLDLGEILRELYRRKWIMLGVTLLAGVVMAAYSLTKPNIYESSAALIVREPQQAIERGNDKASDTAKMLSVETLQTLAESTEITWTLFEVLFEKGVIDGKKQEEQALFRGFQHTLTTTLKKQQSRRGGNAVDLLPILVLKARAQSPEEAQVIANEWATLVEAKSGELYTEGVEALDTYVGDMYDSSNESLIELETTLAAKKLDASLLLKKARLETLTEKITTLEDAIFDIDIELAVNKVAIEEGDKRIGEQEVEEEWIGTVAEEALLKDESYPFSQEELSAQALKVLKLSEQKVRKMEALRVFRQEQNLLAKKTKFTHYQADVIRILAEKAEASDKLPAIDAALAKLSRELEGIPETITLNKAITDDALWELYVNDAKAVTEVATPLKSESLNPLYQSTRKIVIDLTSQAETLRGSTTQLEQSAAAVTALSEKLEREIDALTEELDRRQASLEATKAAITFLRSDYLEEIKLVEELRLTNMRSQAERDIRNEQRNLMMEEAHALEDDISQFELEIEILTRETDKTKNIRMILATKAEEVALLKFSTKNATQTGTSVLWKAQADSNKVAPARSKLVLASMMATLLACGFVVCTAMLLREST